jgi:hypothetical protein
MLHFHVHEDDHLALELDTRIPGAGLILTIGVNDRRNASTLTNAGLADNVVRIFMPQDKRAALYITERLINALSDARAILMDEIADPDKTRTRVEAVIESL